MYGTATLPRGLSAKAATKGKGAAAAAPPPSAPEPNADSASWVLASAGARLRRRRPSPDPLTLLTPEQRQLAEVMAQRPAAPEAVEAPQTPTPLRGLGQLGLPLGPAEVSSLLHQSLSGAVGQNVHFQPFVFSNIFQSASAAATYVAAALEGGANWGRVERFFLAAVEAEDNNIVRGVRVAVSGRMGLKADMAATKVWEWGEMSLRALSDRLDYGIATANTRLGTLGVKVWIRYKTGAIKDVFFPPTGGSHYRAPPAAGAAPTMSLNELYSVAASRTARVGLPYKFSSVGWWERTAPEQPLENRLSELFVAGYNPAEGDRLDHYFRRRREERRRFRSVAERLSYMATTGRFLAKQRRLAKVRAGGAGQSLVAGGDVVALGRRPNRLLARYRLGALTRKLRAAVVLRFRFLANQRRLAKAVENASTISSSQLTLLNHLGTLPSVARNWDSRTAETELRNVDTATYAELELSRSEPTAVQRELAKRHGVALPAGASRLAASATLATVLPPSIRSLAVLYGVLDYDGDVAPSDAAARQLIRSVAKARPHAHSLDTDLSPVSSSQMNELFHRLGYIGRLPYSYGSAQLMALCLRTILADVDDEARLRPLPSLDSRQADLIRYLRSRRAAPGSTRGMPAVLDVDLAAEPPVSRLAAARNILQALMLSAELRDRCLRPRPGHLAALRAVGYGGFSSLQAPSAAPYPDSIAHVKAVLRVLRRADTEAATPATRTALRHLAELRRRTPASSHAAAAAPWVRGRGGGSPAAALGPCPSQLEVRAAIEDLPVSEILVERLFDLGWPGPMPPTHGSALALEDYLLQHKSTTAASISASSRHAHQTAALPPPTTHADAAAAEGASSRAQLRRPGQYGTHHQHLGTSHDRHSRQQPFVSRLGSNPEEALIKIQIRGMFPGAVSEWYLPTMSYEEAEHVLGCLMAARGVVLEQVSGKSYDEYVDRWSEAEAEGDWWGMEWLWH
ncbi:hypothetical protein VOLCADRAFT_107510 [Volvox carteri f. nagariensis]|uniref:Small ribosomal subunit protein uS3 C-terminal domain-containing protein n=1 Tax=Volvox carteri f. nagariensis TaxID=3068 RepID=D8UEG5_VOLCA|nr:uncharacterized protein VOLCADRAFT_107510 [Volvox carteri f. nagariensis]EFJ41879.1 hypothetical protein VOLCADRAFT_107510 [Volvox carteri f. nagariensis]|eukprot:XP_002957077.1 hypothetical protein VOLCADRAFT_107510 [Volvox carteri f. nagariensis]